MLARFECPYCRREGWAEVEVHGVEHEIFDSFESAYYYVLKRVKITETYREEEIYREVARFMIPRIARGCSKKRLIEETSKLFGIAEDDIAGILERVMVEIGAYEDGGVLVT
ncbi:hypothetical protein [Archaeoglobus veneficus]|uniref:Uncharacterized protein n=1 Tax=Archaeoglobus veneficus (strain DSM 11195 / SNP6) TaxID=693661 RepID=F2KSC5_ARCVS|nr:hypothetical protein [Archaeoglobus veneficus]AEA46894.1 hypothetical protein Arcve_0880 [Archaeoglobus veneficus SNP6]